MNFVTIFSVGFMLYLAFVYFFKRQLEISIQVSSIDKETYIVRTGTEKEKQTAADLLARIRINLNKIVKHVYDKYKNDSRWGEPVRRLKRRYSPDPMRITESSEDSNYTSYTLSKGKKMVFCLRSKKTNQFHDFNLLMFVAVHELSHIITVASGSQSHGKEFHTNFGFLLKEATDMGLYEKINFESNPKEYCGIQVTESPI